MAWLSRAEFERRKARGYQTVEPIGGSPAKLAMASWRARLGQLKAQGIGESDPRVIECRAGLAFHRVLKQLQDARQDVRRQGGMLTGPAVAALILELEQPGASLAAVETNTTVVW